MYEMKKSREYVELIGSLFVDRKRLRCLPAKNEYAKCTMLNETVISLSTLANEVSRVVDI